MSENLGKENYFSAMHYSKVMIGNTSSGIIEAASFGKYVINVGDRQKGRATSKNIINAKFDYNDIVNSTEKALKLGNFSGVNIYSKRNTVNLIIDFIKGNNETL